MATITNEFPSADWETPPPFPVRRFTIQEYRRFGELFGEDDRVELLEGWIVPKMNLNPPHSDGVQLVDAAVRQLISDQLVSNAPSHSGGENWCLRVQDAVTIDDSEPEPDLAVVRGAIRDYTEGHPQPKDLGLVVEVADSSLTRDRYKRRVYGRAAVPVYWIVNLTDRQVEVYSDPTGPDPDPGYRRRDDFPLDDSVPLVLAGRELGRIRVRDLLP